MAPFGVKVLCIEPGFFKTTVTDSAIFQSHFQRLWNKLPQEVKDEYGSDYIDKSELKSSAQLFALPVLKANTHSRHPYDCVYSKGDG